MQIFGEAKVQEFGEECVSFFAIHGARDFAANDSATAKLYEILKSDAVLPILTLICVWSMACNTSIKVYYAAYPSATGSRTCTYPIIPRMPVFVACVPHQ